MRHQGVLLGLTQALFHSLLDTCQAGAVLVLSQLANTANTAVTQVVNVVNLTTTVTQVNQDLGDRQNVFVAQHHLASQLFTTNAGVELHAANP